MKRESLSVEQRETLLAEVRSYLPAFLNRSATEQPDPAGDVRELLSLEQQALDRVIAVHQCLAPEVLRFGAALETGLRDPASSVVNTTVVSQAISGGIDWSGTQRERARAPGEIGRYVVKRPGPGTYETDENRAVAWLLAVLEELLDRAISWKRKDSHPGQAQLGWAQKIDLLGGQLRKARTVLWLSGLEAKRPTPSVLQRLRSSRIRFYAHEVPAAIESVMRLSEPSPEALTAVLSERYFQPDDDGTLFEVAVALRLAKAFGALSPMPRRTRLLMGDGRSSFARFGFDDGSEVSIAYQAWPDDQETMRRRFVKRHRIGKRPKDSIPDLIVLRHGPEEDAVILELKASSDSEYLRGALRELLAYLADRPDLWEAQPSGWLVAPVSEAFKDAEADSSFPIWILDADEVVAAVTDRFAPSTP